MNNSVIKDELTDWLIDCNDGVRVEEVRELKKNQLEKNKKNKNFHGYKFEYEIWEFFMSLGPNYISNPLRDAKYKLKEINVEVKANKDHQNDIVAYFDKHIFIVECKSSRTKKPKSYSQLLSAAVDSFRLLGVKNSRIKQLHGNNSYVPIHLVCSRGYKISEQQQSDCLENHKVFLVTEAVRDYIKTVIDVSGSQEFALIQLLGLFREGKPDYGKREIYAFNSKAGSKKQHNVYTFSISPKEMIPISTVSHQAASNIYESKNKIRSFYQRLLTKNRIRQVSEFLSDKHQPFPNNILVNYRGTKKLQFKSDKNLNQSNKKKILGNIPGTLSFDACPATFHVIDGQHRLFGYTGVEKRKGGIRENHRVLVTAFDSLNVEEEADVFLDVNTNAKPVKPGLVMEIEYSTEKVFKRNLATAVVFKLREKEDSALYRLINEGEGTRKPLNPKDLQSSLLACTTLLGKKDYWRGYFWNINGSLEWTDLEECAEKIYNHINKFLLMIKNDNKNLWFKFKKLSNGKEKNGILQNILIGGLFIVANRITEDVLESNKRPSKNNLIKHCMKYYELVSKGIKSSKPSFRNDKLLQITNWFGAGKRGQANVASAYIFNFLNDKYPRMLEEADQEFIDIHYDPERDPEEVEEIKKEERRLGREIVDRASNLPYKVKVKRNTKGKRYSSAIKRIIKYALIKNDHIAGDPWIAIVSQDAELKKNLTRKQKLHQSDIDTAGAAVGIVSPWRKLEAPELKHILSNVKYIRQSKPGGTYSSKDERLKRTIEYVWNNLTIFPDHPYPHNLPQPKDRSPLWDEGFEYMDIFYKFRNLSDGDSLDDAHLDEVDTLSLHENEFDKFDDYENKFRIMSQRIAKIFEDEDSNLLPQILSDT